MTEMMTIGYQNEEAHKRLYVERAKAHRLADEVIQGTGWTGKKGCCVGCLAHAYPAHATLARDIGGDERLWRLADAIHEGLPLAAAKGWPERIARAIPVGADLSLVWPRFAVRLMERLEPLCATRPDALTAVRAVGDLWAGVVAGIDVPPEEFAAAAAAAAAWAAAAAARAAAREDFWRTAADDLVEIIEACPKAGGGA